MDNQDYNPEDLLSALRKREVPKLRKIFEEYNSVDIADTLNKIDNPAELLFIFKTVPSEYTAEVFTYLDNDVQEHLIRVLNSDQIGDILTNINSDDIVDFIEEMPSNLVVKILHSADSGTRKDINHLLNYKENSAGSLMTTEFVQLKADETVQQAISRIRKTGREAETISYLFVTDNNRKLVGTLKLKDLVFADSNQMVSEIMDQDFVCVKTMDDQEEVAKAFKRYDLNALPVLTADNHLVGIITVDDILDVIEEEATEDIQKMAAMEPLQEEYLKLKPFTIAKKRITWLMVLMISATFTGLIINRFENLLVALPALTIFIPMIMDTGGNSGGQASTTIIRSLALGEIETKQFGKVLVHEMAVAALTGGILAVFVFAWVNIESLIGLIQVSGSAPAVEVAALVACTVFITVFLAKSLGATLPIFAKKIGLDPALMAQPILTTIVDALSLMVYFLLATQVFNLL